MKIGIITLWRSSWNYGQVLQLYAMQTALKKLGHEAFLIRFLYSSPEKIKRKISLSRLQQIFNLSKLYLFLSRLLHKEKDRNFDDFRRKHIKESVQLYSSPIELQESPPQANAYIAGSDQIWNANFCQETIDELEIFFLHFGGERTKRIAYAPSFGGWKPACLDMKNALAVWLKNLNAISVRDAESQNVCREILHENVPLVVDPCLLLSQEDYVSRFEGTIPNVSYCLVYHLYGISDINIRKIRKFCKKNHLKLIYAPVLQPKIKEAVYPSIGEWLNLVAHADFVVTNSFHGTVFSMLFQRKFVTFLARNISQNGNGRLLSLLEQFQAEDRLFKKENSLQHYFDLPAFSNSLKDVVDCSMNFLKKALSHDVQTE